MKQFIIVSLLTLLIIGMGCTTEEGDGSGDSDSDGDSDGDGDGDSDGDADTDGDTDGDADTGAENIPSGTATIQFCNQIFQGETPIVATLAVSDGSQNVTFNAQSNCCTNCGSIPAGSAITLALFDGERELRRTQISINPNQDYVIYAVVVDGAGALTMNDLEAGTCDSFVPLGMQRCAK